LKLRQPLMQLNFRSVFTYPLALKIKETPATAKNQKWLWVQKSAETCQNWLWIHGYFWDILSSFVICSATHTKTSWCL